jgi:hypothetical protein
MIQHSKMERPFRIDCFSLSRNSIKTYICKENGCSSGYNTFWVRKLDAVFINYNSLYIRYKWNQLFIYEESTNNNYKKLQQILLRLQWSCCAAGLFSTLLIKIWPKLQLKSVHWKSFSITCWSVVSHSGFIPNIFSILLK